jgi:hypothetical protein
VLFQHEFSCYCIENFSFRNTKISTRIDFNTLVISNTGVLSVYGRYLRIPEFKILSVRCIKLVLSLKREAVLEWHRLRRVTDRNSFLLKSCFKVIKVLKCENQCFFFFFPVAKPMLPLISY